MARCRRVAVIYPVEILESVPIVRNTIEMFAKNHFLVDVFVVDSAGTKYPEVRFSEPNIFVHSLPVKRNRPGILRFVPNFLTFTVWAWFLCLRKRFLCFIGVDPVGLVMAAILAMVYLRPWIYLSLELIISSDPVRMYRRYKHLERWCSRQADLIIIQDEMRARLMADDNNIPMSRFVFLPNSPLGPARGRKTRVLQEKFGFKANDKILLNAGSIADWALSRELAQLAQKIPENWKLVFQTRANYQDLDGYFGELLNTRNLLISNQAVPLSELPELVSSADIGVALYNLPESPNVVYMGKSSGKLCQYLHCGIPVIAARMPGWQEKLERYHSGISVDSVDEIKEAAEHIFAEYEHFSQGALEHFEKELRFEPAFSEVLLKIEDLISKGNSNYE